MIKTFLLLLILSSSTLFAQENSDTTIYDFPDVEAEFPGGAAALQRFIVEIIHYPEQALEDDFHGRVYLSFIVEKDGCITNIKVERSVHELLDQESIRVVKAMPQWIPGEVNGKVVRTRVRFPVVYCI